MNKDNMKPIFIPLNHDYLREGFNDEDVKWFWQTISEKTEDIDFLLDFEDKIKWEYLSRNPNAVELLEKNQDKINWNNLGANKNPKAIALLRENMDKLVKGYCPKYDLYDLFKNDTKEAAELIKELLHKLKPGEKYSFISNRYCNRCREYAGISRCPICVRNRWDTMCRNGYMIPQIEDFVRSKEFKRFYENKKDSEEKRNKFKASFIYSLACNKRLTPFLVNEIIKFFWFYEKKISVHEDFYKSEISSLLRAMIYGTNKKLFKVVQNYLKNTFDREIINEILCVRDITHGLDREFLKESQEEFVDIIEKKAYLFIIELNGNENKDDVDRQIRTFWMHIASIRHPKIITLIEKNIEYINKLTAIDPHECIWKELNENPYAISLINKYPQYLDYYCLIHNSNKDVVYSLIENAEKINWECLDYLGELSEILNYDKKDTDSDSYISENGKSCFWYIFYEQTKDFNERSEKSIIYNDYDHKYDDDGYIFARRNLQNLYNKGFKTEKLRRFLYDTDSIEFLRNNIHYFSLSGVSEYNASIVRAIFYKLDYENMKKNNLPFSEELMSYVFNPDRISRLSKLYNVEFVDIINSLQ